MPADRRSYGLLLGIGVAMALIGFAGCSSASVQRSTPVAPTPTGSPLPAVTATDVPVGTDVSPVSSGPALVTSSPARVVPPHPGQLDVHPIPARAMSARRSGPHTVIDVDFTTGAAPCHVLDSVLLAQNGGTIAFTLEEGHGPDSGTCSDIPVAKRTVVDLGTLNPGQYTVSDATGGAPTISFTVSTYTG